MIVVAIIAILSLVALTVYSNIQKNARDSRRRGDIDSISKSFETHYVSTTTSYSPPDPSGFVNNSIPKDPNGSEYFWNGSQSIPTAATTTYTICALLENNNGNSSTVGDGSTFSSASGSSATYFCKKNSQ